MPRIVIVGGHGKVALLAAPKLAAAGYRVQSIVRNAAHSNDVVAGSAEPVVLDIETADVDALANLFRGADAIVFSAGAGGGNPARTRAVDFEAAVRTMDAAEQAGVKRYVMVSYVRAETDVDRLEPSDSFYAYAKAKHDADKYLRGTDLDYTILGPGALTLEPARRSIRIVDHKGESAEVELDASKKVTSRENVAEVIAHVVANDAAVRETVNFYDGDTAITDALPSA